MDTRLQVPHPTQVLLGSSTGGRRPPDAEPAREAECPVARAAPPARGGARRDRRGRPSARVVVLGSRGPVFCSGHDLGEMIGRTEEEYRDLFAACSRVMLGLRRLPQPVIARVQGVATAAGCQLVAACDLAVAAEEATFATPGVKIGLFCTTPMVPLVRAIPDKAAMEMLLTGAPISAERALELGLVNRVVPAEELDAADPAVRRHDRRP